MSFGGFLDNSTGNGGARIVADISFTSGNNNMASSAIAQPRLVTQSLTKTMFNSPGLSLALVRRHRLITIFLAFSSLLRSSFVVLFRLKLIWFFFIPSSPFSDFVLCNK